MAGASQGPTPWWQTPGQQSNYDNMVSSAPPGYRYDPVKMGYERTPTSLGADTGQAMTGLYGALPQGLSNLFGGQGSFGSGPASPAGFGAPQVSWGGGFGGGGTSPYTPPNIIGAPKAPSTISSSPLPSQVQYSGTAAQIGAVKGPDTSASTAAAYATAKDRAGLEARAALTGLSGAMAGRGIVGSGVEGRGQLGVITQGQQAVGQASRDEAVKLADIAEQNALATYQGDIAQRGQNLQNLQFGAGLGVTQRGQDISAQEAANQALVAQRGQDIGLQGLEYQGGITQRGQDISAGEAAAQRNLSALEAQYSGGITQRGQDIGAAETAAQLGLSQQELNLRRQQAALGALQGFGSTIGRTVY